MDYEKKYKEALERARVLMDEGRVDVEKGTTTCEYIFPELKESEDEKIRKALIKYYSFDKNESPYALDNFTPKQIVAWLEKQGEQKETLCDKCRKEQPDTCCELY